jgi:hypothetical protein
MGLFHPIATCKIHGTGSYPDDQLIRLIDDSGPLAVYDIHLQSELPQTAPALAARLQGFDPVTDP